MSDTVNPLPDSLTTQWARWAGSLAPVGPGPIPLPIALRCGTECMLIWLTFLDYVSV